MTLKELAQEALAIQDACNLVAVAKGFAEAMKSLKNDHGLDTDEIRQHPITTLWVSKLESLNAMRTTNEFHTDYIAVCKLAQGKD